MLGSVPPLPQYASMAWCSVKKSTGTTLSFTFISTERNSTVQYLQIWEAWRSVAARWTTAHCIGRCEVGWLSTAPAGSTSNYRKAIHTEPRPWFVCSNSHQEFGSCPTGWIATQFLYEGVSKSFRTVMVTKSTTINTRWEATQRVMAAKLTRLTHKIAMQLHLVAAVTFTVIAPGGQFGNFWIHYRTSQNNSLRKELFKIRHRPQLDTMLSQFNPVHIFMAYDLSFFLFYSLCVCFFLWYIYFCQW
jgi:hypothetical protein